MIPMTFFFRKDSGNQAVLSKVKETFQVPQASGSPESLSALLTAVISGNLDARCYLDDSGDFPAFRHEKPDGKAFPARKPDIGVH